MTSHTWTWVIATLEVVTALGFTWLWVGWLRGDHDEPWSTAGSEDRETPLVVPGSAAVVILLASAILLVLDEPLGESLALVAGGMVVFLGLLDAAYFSRTGRFARERGGLLNLGLVTGLLAMGLLLIGSFA